MLQRKFCELLSLYSHCELNIFDLNINLKNIWSIFAHNYDCEKNYGVGHVVILSG